MKEAAKKLFSATTTSHFLPKFDNQNFDKRLASVVRSNFNECGIGNGRGVFYVSKKHSGSLVMAPPFYSKNGSGNEFSRFGCVLLHEFFRAVWPQEGSKKFVEWWKDAESRNLCYSFECVAPRILGDHGATPSCAYMVLTSVSFANHQRFMSPAELLQIATKWRLPLNEVWYFDGKDADMVEKELHKRRWVMQDSDATAMLNQIANDDSKVQSFLKHSETQGQVLEGFVLMALDAQYDEMTKLVQSYNATMKPFHDAALKVAKSMGDRCLDPKESENLLKSLRNATLDPLNKPEIYREPEKYKDLTQADACDLVCNQLHESKTQKLLLRLVNAYGHVVRLVPYKYNNSIQLQIHVRDDEVFYGWPLHTQDGSTGMLYRGMVITLMDDEAVKKAQETFDEPPSDSQVKILGIAKLKCLNYMWRTFGVRNRLTILLNRGKEGYLKTIKQGFYKPWGIPREYSSQMDGFFAKWADFAMLLPKQEQAQLTKSYLPYVEKFLAQTPYPLTANPSTISVPLAAKGAPPRICSLYILHFDDLSKQDCVAMGFDQESRRLLPDLCDGVQGIVNFTNKFPKIDTLNGVDVLIVLQPKRKEDGSKSSHAKACEAFTKRILPSLKKKLPNLITVITTDINKQLWMGPWAQTQPAVVANQGEMIQGEVEDAVVDEELAVKDLPKVLILTTVALPPGGGKSTLFHCFGDFVKANNSDLIRYDFKSSDDFKGREKFENAFKRCFPSPDNRDHVVTCIGYDKNIPNGDGLRRLVTMLDPLSRRFNIRVLMFAPQQLDHDIWWGRVKVRDPTTHIGLAIGPKLNEGKAYGIFKDVFFDPSEEFLPFVTTAPGVHTTNSFVERDGVGTLTAEVNEMLGSFSEETFESIGGSFSDVAKWLDDNDSLLNDSSLSQSSRCAPENAKWCCADLEHNSKLHVTLVPPPKSNADNKDPQRMNAMAALRGVAGREVKIIAKRYHIAELVAEPVKQPNKKFKFEAEKLETRNVKRIAFWEVDTIDGLPENIDLGEQAKIFHITDRASMTRGVQAKNSGEILRQMRSGTLTQWIVKSEDHPIELYGKISFYL